MLSDKYLKINLNKFGFRTYDTEVKEMIEMFLVNFLKNKLGKKQKPTVGGRVVLPSEYFGKPSQSYFETLANNGTDMSVTDSVIRPVVETHDISGAITGGKAQCFNVSLKTYSIALKEAKSKITIDEKQDTTKFKEEFEGVISKMLTQITKKKACHLSVDILRTESNKRQYRSLVKV
jgi:hypothetical protein